MNRPFFRLREHAHVFRHVDSYRRNHGQRTRQFSLQAIRVTIEHRPREFDLRAGGRQAEPRFEQRRGIGPADQPLVVDCVGVTLLRLRQPEGLRVRMTGGDGVRDGRLRRLVVSERLRGNFGIHTTHGCLHRVERKPGAIERRELHFYALARNHVVPVGCGIQPQPGAQGDGFVELPNFVLISQSLDHGPRRQQLRNEALRIQRIEPGDGVLNQRARPRLPRKAVPRQIHVVE